MSHFTVMVIGDNPEKQLEPFDENISVPEYDKGELPQDELDRFVEYYANEQNEKSGTATITTIDVLYKKHGKDWNGNSWKKHSDGSWHEYSSYNPNSKWDWYQLGGRWTGFFKLTPQGNGSVGERSLVSDRTPKEGYADQAMKKDIDFDYMRKKAAKDAADTYDLAMDIFGDTPLNETWDKIKEIEPDRDAARELYWSQPRCKAWKEKEKEMGRKWKFGLFDSPDDFLVSKEDYIIDEANSAISPFAVLKDGKWHEKGKMGWFGMASNEKEQAVWNREVAKMLNELPEDELISLYDCHI